jgi:hypothetical protein
VECRVRQEKRDRSFRVLQDQFIGPTMNAILLGWQATRLLRTATFCSAVQVSPAMCSVRLGLSFH